MKKISLLILIMLIILCLPNQSYSEYKETGWLYWNLVGGTVSSGYISADLLGIGYIHSFSRIGFNVHLFNYTYDYNSINYKMVNEEVNKSLYGKYWLPINLYFVPFAWGKEFLFFYGSYSGLGSITIREFYYNPVAFSVKNSEIGIGYNFNINYGLLNGQIKIYNRLVNIPSQFKLHETGEYTINETKVNQIGISLNIYIGGNSYNNGDDSRCYGFLPFIMEPIEQAKLAKPSIDSVYPQKLKAGEEVKISGSKFRPEEKNTQVKIDNVEAQIINITDNTISTKVPGGTKIKDVEVKVVTARGESNTTSIFINPSKPPRLEIKSISFIDDNKNNILEAEERASIILDVNNAKGAGDALNLSAKVKQLSRVNGISFSESINIGDIEPSETKKVKIPINANLDLPTGKTEFNISVQEPNGYEPDPFKVSFETKAVDPPDIELVNIEIDDKNYPDNPEKLCVGNGDSIIQPGESIEVKAKIINKGVGNTKGSKISVLSENKYVELLSGNDEIKFGDIEPGKWKDIKFAFTIKKQYKEKDLLFKISVVDNRERFNKTLPINLSVGKLYTTMQVVDIKGKAIETPIISMPSFGDELLKIPVYKTKTRDNAYAVIIGIEKYRDIISAEYAAKDAQTVKDYLITAMGFKEENIMYALNERASRNDLIKYFTVWLKNNVEEDSIVFVYYSGHGAPNPTSGESYIVPYDGDPNTIKDSGFSLKQLYESLNKLPTQCILVAIDACFSGAGGPRTVLAKGARPLVVTKEIETGSTVVLTATGGGQISGSYEEKQHGLFTYFFLKGLQGEADINKDKKILVSELYEYLKPQVIKIARKNNREQEPQILPSISQIGEWLKLPLAVLK